MIRHRHRFARRQRDAAELRMIRLICMTAGLAMLCSGCGHMKVSKVGLLSFGDLEGRTIPSVVQGPVLKGSDNEAVFVPPGCFSFLSAAVEDALAGTEYDTLVDCTVTSYTGFFAWSNGIRVEGTALNSKTLPRAGERK